MRDMVTLVDYVPIATTLLAAVFSTVVFRRWLRRRPAPHLLWWAAGIALYGVGTFAESYTTLFGWREPVFRLWYVSGALLGAAPLAQGTVYLMLSRRTADIMAVVLGAVVTVAAISVWTSPVDAALVEPHGLSGRVLSWQWVRAFSPFINTYAVIFLVGGAVVSAWRYHGDPSARHRFVGNCFIAVGALLPGFGGVSARMGHTEVLYVTELVGIVLIWIGYAFATSGDAEPTSSFRASAT